MHVNRKKHEKLQSWPRNKKPKLKPKHW
ncbi:IgA-specific serine endopeptidase autotransporter precursor, partial [Haemophilus influenzae]